MPKEKNYKKFIIVLNVILILLLFIIVLNFTIHAIRTYDFNKQNFTLSSGETSESVEMYGKLTGFWPKEDAVVPGVTNGGTYEITISNLEDYDIKTWGIRLNITEECYLNQGWNGKIEVHQNVKSGNEKIDTVDLHNFDIDYDNLKIESKGEGKNDLMIHLYEGDYLIYYPLDEEFPLGGYNTSVTIGMIFYYNEVFTEPELELTYQYGKSVTYGSEFVIFIVLSLLWILIFSIALVWSVVRRKARKDIEEREAILEETMELITSFVDAKDAYTKGHSNRVADYTVLLAEKLGMSKTEVRHAFYAATLHDIGKCYVPDEILKKSGKLTAEEFEIIKTHTTYGGEMLKSINTIKNIADGAKYHHERYDGNGYPEGLRGTAIPYIGRIICVADSFDAMTSFRCYRDALSKEKVLDEIKNNLGKQFDPVVGQAMLKLIADNKIVIENWENS